MNLDSLHISLIALVSSIVSGLAVKFWGFSSCVKQEELEAMRLEIVKHCEAQKAACGVGQITHKIDILTSLIRLLCEKNGITVEQQLDIESIRVK
jgi:hypothetical protein